jgi:hypothetical protein
VRQVGYYQESDYAVAVPFRSGAAYLRKTLPRNRESLPAYRKEVYTHSVASTLSNRDRSPKLATLLQIVGGKSPTHRHIQTLFHPDTHKRVALCYSSLSLGIYW